jgi:TRAP-type C4-dicarboxylate transport system permease small subunit
LRIPFVVISEVCILGFFALLAWVGFEVLMILKGDSLISLPQVPTRLTQSVIPIGAIRFIIAELLGIPELLRKAGKPDGFANIDLPAETEPNSNTAATEVPRP